MLVTISDIRAAAERVGGVALRTPLLTTPAWPSLALKPENLQPIGAFKIRGAVNALARLDPAVRAAGVVAHSSGNHGQALAYAARRLGVPCGVVMPDVSAPVKIEAVRALGARVDLVPVAERLTEAMSYVERGMTLVPPFDHPDIIAGAGTVGLEIATDAPDLAAVLVPVGGGGLASGLAAAIKALSPSTVVVGVEPELAADAAESLAAGTVVQWAPERLGRTSADGLRTNLSPLTLTHLRTHLDGIVTVTEDELLSTVGSLARTARLVAERSGAAAPAAYLHRFDELAQRFGLTPSSPVAAVVSGGNLDPALLARLLT